MRADECDDRRCSSPATHETTLVTTAADGQPQVLRAQLCDAHELTDDDRIVPLEHP